MKTFRILLIEDNSFFLGIWDSIIGRSTNSPYKLDWANTDYIAREMLETNKYDIVISDIILTGSKTGFDIWKDFNAQNCCFIFSSSMPQEDYDACIKELNKRPDRFIPKPLKINECVRYISEVFLKKQTNPLKGDNRFG